MVPDMQEGDDSSELEHTYMEIFQKFKDFDQTRIRRDSETSLIKE
jgi:hypothetical protein